VSEFVKLACPSCGGELKVRPGAMSMVCEHCGSEHLVRREAGSVTLESYARCPKCGRNDRVEKVTAILSSHTQTVTSTEERTELYTDSKGKQHTRTVKVPITKLQMSDLAARLSHPDTPSFAGHVGKNPTGTLLALGILITCASVLALGAGVCTAFGAFGTQQGPEADVLATGLATMVTCAFPPLVGLAAGVALTYWAAKRRRVASESYRLALEQAASARKEVQQRWQKARDRWENLYYCYRDDCVFVPDEGTFAPLSRKAEYLYHAE
jgi:predicted RNA-binding Zn-ribbon protein involved in translation (DUF1610 family)